MCELLEGVDDRYNKVMMVGHNPAMTSLLNTLCDVSIFNMPTAAVAVIGYDMDSWSELEGENGILLGYGYPKGPADFKSGVRD